MEAPFFQETRGGRSAGPQAIKYFHSQLANPATQTPTELCLMLPAVHPQAIWIMNSQLSLAQSAAGGRAEGVLLPPSQRKALVVHH